MYKEHPLIGRLTAATLALTLTLPALADLTVTNARVRAVIAGQDKTVGYFDVHNTGAQAEALTAASSDSARAIEMHEIIHDGDMVRMRRQASVNIPAGGTISFAPGGLHLMLFGVTDLPVTVTITLTSASGEQIAIPFKRVALGAEGS
jgi:copper(I)-binding protein